ncbi:MAG: molybdopterin biosynthesis protein [Candidatus Acetothermia bacterium]
MEMRKEFRDLIGPEKAKEIIDNHFLLQDKIGRVKLRNAVGGVVAQPVQAPLDVPGFSRSLMDGYAIQASDSFGADEGQPAKVRINGRALIGRKPEVEVSSGQAVQIATGAPIPPGGDAVIKVENTERDDHTLYLKDSVIPGENVLQAGSDISLGDLVLQEGTKLRPPQIGLLAALGKTHVSVYLPPQVGIVSTGPELVPPADKLDFGQVHDVNSHLLATGVKQAGGRPRILGIVRDDPEEIESIFRRAASECELVISSGGTSAGAEDMGYRILEAEGEILAHGIKIKPGKPTILAKLDNVPFFGLPGNPSSAYVIFDKFVAPLIRKVSHSKSRGKKQVRARTADRLTSEGGRKEQKYVGLVKRNEELRAYPINKASGAVTLLTSADGYVDIPEGNNFVPENKQVNVNLLTRSLELPELLVMGSNCIALQRLLSLLPRSVRSLNRGSKGGVNAISRGIADLAGLHIWTEAGYNIPYLKELNTAEKATLVKGYNRTQGLMVAPGNPKDIDSVEDLLTRNLSIINRNAGSGTRLLFDNLLSEAARGLGEIEERIPETLQGYNVEVSTHNAVAAAVNAGKADVGLGIETVAREKGLHFLELKEEEYDILIRNEIMDTPAGKEFREKLASEEFHTILDSLPGLAPKRAMGEVIYP